MNHSDKPVDSLPKRYFYKLGSKFINIPVNIISSAIIPRALGVEAYGSYNFIVDFFTRLISFFDSGSSVGFYSKLSQRIDESTLIRFYWGIILIICSLIILFASSVFVLGLQEKVWIGQKALFIWLGLFVGLLSWINQLVNKIMDAYGLSVRGELSIVKQRLIGITILGILYISGNLNLEIFFLYNFIILLILLYLWRKILKDNGLELIPRKRLSVKLIKSYSQEFYKFSQPLFIGGLVVFIFGYADRWLLQLYGGANQQGLFSLSLKVGALCYLITGSMVPLFQREISKAYGEKNLDGMRIIFERFVPMFFSLSVSIGVFFFFQAENVSMLLGGVEYSGAAIPVSIMSLYPIHQTYGQLNSSVFFALGRTKIYRNIAVITTIFGIILTFILLAPRSMNGLDMGSTGLAIKMVFVQLVGQNILLWFNTKFFKISFGTMFIHQIKSIIIIGSAAAFASYLSSFFFAGIITSFIIAGLVYLIALTIILYYVPSLFSTSRDEVNRNLQALIKKLLNR
jgi:O-antigen/teichoic acid export membrane protein